MRIVCAWCKKELGEKEPLTNKETTHGICSECATKMMSNPEPYIKLLGSFSDGLQLMKAWTVDATYVRAHYPNGIEFTMGGHHLVYPFIPDNEIWLDSALPPEELNYTLHDHELPEHYLMKFKYLPYSKAHNIANARELQARKSKEERSKWTNEEIERKLDYDPVLALELHRNMVKELYKK